MPRPLTPGMRVAILGCGYVGTELGRRLDDAGHEAVGVRRSPTGVQSVADAGLQAVQADVTVPGDLEAVPDVDVLVYAASAGRDGDPRAVYVEGLRTAVEQFGAREDRPDRLLYTSSTAVYGDRDGDWVDEDTPLDPADGRTSALVTAERVALEEAAVAGIDGTVARLAGLYGPRRYWTDRYLDGPLVEGYVNMVHRDDVADALAHLLATDAARGDVVNVVDDEPVARETFARWLADQRGVDPPEVLPGAVAAGRADVSRRALSSKRVANDRLHGFGYEFTYPTFREGYAGVVTTTNGQEDG